MNRDAGRLALAIAAVRVAVLMAAVLAIATACGVPSQALAADVPDGDIGHLVMTIARQQAKGPVVWARYVVTTPDTAARLLGKSRDQLDGGMPDRVYLVVMRGDFSLEGMGKGRAPYLAFVYWPIGDTWNASDFTLRQRPVPMSDAGVPHDIESFWLAHLTLDRARVVALALLFWFLPVVLLVVSAVICARTRRSRWPFALAACVAAAVAAWQIYLMVSSLAGRSWDPVFDGVKLAILVVVVSVDLAAAYALLRLWSRSEAPGPACAVGRLPGLRAGVVLLVVAAVLYLVTLPGLASTGS